MKISIITITYKDLDGLKKTLQSVLEQTFTDFECWVIDGGSGPEVTAFLQGLGDPRIFWVSEKDEGIYDALNKGISRATGEWQIFLNGGDTFFKSTTLESIAPTLTDGHDIVYGDYGMAFSDTDCRLKKARNSRFIYYGMFTCHQSMLFRTESVGQLRYSTAHRIAGDYQFVCELIKRGAVCKRLDLPVCRFDMGGASNKYQSIGRAEYAAVQREILGVPHFICTIFGMLHAGAAFVKALKNQLREEGR